MVVAVPGRSMSLGDHALVRGSDRHVMCFASPNDGWSVCLAAWDHGVGVRSRGAGCTRVVLAETSTRGRRIDLSAIVERAAARLLDAGMSAKDSLEALLLLASRQSGGRLGGRRPGPSMSVLDLHGSGVVEAAGRLVPPVLHMPARGPARCYQIGEQEDPHRLRLAPGDHLAAFTSSFVRLASENLLASIPDRARAEADPCRLRDQLGADADMQSSGGQMPPLVLVVRT